MCFLSILISLLLIIFIFRKIIKKLVPVIVIFLLLCSVTFRNNQNIVYRNFSRFFNDTKTVNDVLIEKTRKRTSNKKYNKIKTLNNTGTYRGLLWSNGLKYIGKKPIIGYGIEYIQELYRRDRINQTRPHNMIIQMGVSSGIPGIILYLTFILGIFYSLIIVSSLIL